MTKEVEVEDDEFVDVYLVGVAPKNASESGPQRALDARYIGEVILDAWFGSQVAKDLKLSASLADEDVAIMAEVVRDESAVLTLFDNKLTYPERLTDNGLRASSARLEYEIMRRWKAQVPVEGEA